MQKDTGKESTTWKRGGMASGDYGACGMESHGGLDPDGSLRYVTHSDSQGTTRMGIAGADGSRTW